MPDNVPKPASQRRRRNAVAGLTKLPAVSRRRAPTLPKREPAFLAATRAWWRVVWASPMAAVYLDADVPALVRLAGLVDEVHAGWASADDLREIRALEDRFGLSPLARRRLQWEVDQAGARTPAASAEAQSERWLRVAS